jgi:hypothetical protein
MSVIAANDFETKNITITVPRSLQSGAKSSWLNYNGSTLIMQSAQDMSAPFGLNCADKFGPPEYSVDLSFRGADQSDDLKLFQTKLEQFDEFMINEGVKNSKSWFKAELSRDVIKAFYTPMVKYSKDKEGNVLSYPPTIKLKMRRNDGQFVAQMYNKKGEAYKDTPMEDLIVKGSKLTAIMECRSVWFSGSKYGVTWQAKQIAVEKTAGGINGFAFKGLQTAVSQEVDDDEVFGAASAAAPRSVVSAFMPQTPASSPAAPLAPLTSSGVLTGSVSPMANQTPMAADDDEDGEDMEPVPAPRPVIKKKVVAKK